MMMDRKGILIMSVIGLVVGAVFFWDQVVGIFQGMSPLEAMKFIITFLLHVVVVTVLSYMLYTAPEIVKPWMRALKKRRSHRGTMTNGKQERAPRLNTDQMLRLYIAQQMSGRTKRDVPPSASDDIDIRY